MLSVENLRQMSQIDIATADPDSLADIHKITVEHEAPVEQRLESYLRQIKNPYAFICEGVKVKISFADSDRTLDNALIRYFYNLTIA